MASVRPFGPCSLAFRVSVETPKSANAFCIGFVGFSSDRRAWARFWLARCAVKPWLVIDDRAAPTSLKLMPAAEAAGTIDANALEKSCRLTLPCATAVIIFEVTSPAADAFRW